MTTLFISSEEKKRPVEFSAVADGNLHLSRVKGYAKSRKTGAKPFIEGALYNVSRVKYTSARETTLCASFLQTQIKAS